MIFQRRHALGRMGLFRRRTVTPGIRIGEYESGLLATWAWERQAHLLVVERDSYGAGENLVRMLASKYDGERVQLDPKGYRFRDHQPWMHMTYEECATKVAQLNLVATLRASQIELGEDVEPMLVTVPELHDSVDLLGQRTPSATAAEQFVSGLRRLLTIGRAGRIHVLANIRQGYIYPAYLPQEMRKQFGGLLVLGKTSDAVTQQLNLPRAFDRPHGRLGDMEGGFWPLEVRIR